MRWRSTAVRAAVVLGALTAGCRREDRPAATGAPEARAVAAAPRQEGAPAAPARDDRQATQAPARDERQAARAAAGGDAQTAQAPARGPEVREPAQQPPVSGADAAGEVGVLRSQVQALRDEVDRLRAEVLQLRAGEPASGGAAGPRAQRDTPPPVLATTTFVGTVQRVGPRQVDVRDPEGDLYTLRVDERTRVLRGGRRIALSALPEGARVRSAVELRGGDTHASELVVLSGTRRGRR